MKDAKSSCQWIRKINGAAVSDVDPEGDSWQIANQTICSWGGFEGKILRIADHLDVQPMNLFRSLEALPRESHLGSVVSMPIPKTLDDYGSFLIDIDFGMPKGEPISKTGKSIESWESEPGGGFHGVLIWMARDDFLAHKKSGAGLQRRFWGDLRLEDLAERCGFVEFPVVGHEAGGIGCGGLIHGFGDPVLKLVTEAGHQFKSRCGHFHHHLAAVVDGVGALHVSELFQAIYQSSGGSCRVTHLAGDVRHGHLLRRRKKAEEKELGERNVVAIQLFRQVQQEFALAEQNEICQLRVILGEGLG